MGLVKRLNNGMREEGQSLTETAISFTFILFLLAGAVDLGRAFFTYTALREAAQEGAVYGSFDPLDIANIENRVRTSSNAPLDLTDASVTVNVEWTISGYGDLDSSTIGSVPEEEVCSGNGNAVRALVSYNLPLTMPIIGMILPDQELPLTAVIEHIILVPTCP